MRDIRDDLQERLELADKSKALISSQYEAEKRELEARYRQRVGALENEALTIRSLLDIEARRNATASKKPIAPKLPIGDYFLRELQSGPKSKDELRDAAAAAGYVSGGENPGRSTHAILLNLIKAHRIMVGPDGKILMMPALDQLMDQPIGTILDVVRNEQRLGDTEPLTKN